MTHIVIPVHNRPEDIEALLKSLKNLDVLVGSWKVTVVDDGSEPPLDEALVNLLPDGVITLLRNDTPQGPGAGRNQATRAVESDYVWYLDSDTLIHDCAVLKTMIKRFDADPKLGGIGGVIEKVNDVDVAQKLDILPNFMFIYRSYDPPASSPAGYVDGLGTCNLMIRRSLYDAVEGFDENLKRDEDNDLCMKGAARGMRFYQGPDTLVTHNCSPTGRSSGFFSHFTDKERYVRDLLDTRLVLLGRHARIRLAILPLLDVVVAPLVKLRIMRGIYSTNRIDSAGSKEKKGISLITAAQLAIGSYLKGFALFFSGGDRDRA